MRLWPWPRSISTSVVSSRVASSCGVSVPRTSASVAKAVTIRLTGEVTFFLIVTATEAPSCTVHCVRIDSESLPTGMEMPSAGHSSMPDRLDGGVEVGVFAGFAAGGHPVGGKLDARQLDRRGQQVGDGLGHRHAP